MNSGTVKWFNEDKGFGFIGGDRGQDDVFVHISELRANGCRTLKEGDKVTFDTEKSSKSNRIHAVNVQIA